MLFTCNVSAWRGMFMVSAELHGVLFVSACMQGTERGRVS